MSVFFVLFFQFPIQDAYICPWNFILATSKIMKNVDSYCSLPKNIKIMNVLWVFGTLKCERDSHISQSNYFMKVPTALSEEV